MFQKHIKKFNIKVNEKQRLTLAFLQKKEKEDSYFSAEELSIASTYPLKESLKAKLSRSEFGEFIIMIGKNTYKAQNTIGINPEEYAYKTSSNYRNLNPTKAITSNIQKKLSDTLLEKSIQAILAAIEIYNKPDFGYREETFSILIVNAWEILLKAKIVLDSNQNIEAIYIKDKEGEGQFVKSRSGNNKTISIGLAMKALSLDETLNDNLKILIEFRDNSIHLKNDNSNLNIKLQEIGTASLKSYLEICKEWFNKNLSKYNFYIMPMSFYHPHEMASHSILSDSKQNQNLINYISKKEEKHPYNISNDHQISLHLETKFVKSKMKFDSNDPDAISVVIQEENIFETKFIWSCRKDLIPHLKKRYNDFKQTPEFWDLLKKLKGDKKFCRIRYLNSKEQKGTKQEWYDPNIVKEFDKYYTKNN